MTLSLLRSLLCLIAKRGTPKTPLLTETVANACSRKKNLRTRRQCTFKLLIDKFLYGFSRTAVSIAVRCIPEDGQHFQKCGLANSCLAFDNHRNTTYPTFVNVHHLWAESRRYQNDFKCHQGRIWGGLLRGFRFVNFWYSDREGEARAPLLGGSGGMLPRKILKIKERNAWFLAFLAR